ncbi:MAG: hypothetical protein FWG14_07705 [Peptococcaceae bacterium]|nr:hypothetical protein [Peptococcaceae bacterium]
MASDRDQILRDIQANETKAQDIISNISSLNEKLEVLYALLLACARENENFGDYWRYELGITEELNPLQENPVQVAVGYAEYASSEMLPKAGTIAADGYENLVQRIWARIKEVQEEIAALEAALSSVNDTLSQLRRSI